MQKRKKRLLFYFEQDWTVQFIQILLRFSDTMSNSRKSRVYTMILMSCIVYSLMYGHRSHQIITKTQN